jgi:hypothetical protein
MHGAHEEVHAQHQMMKVMLMTMMNKIGGETTATHHLAQAWDKFLANRFLVLDILSNTFVNYNI